MKIDNHLSACLLLLLINCTNQTENSSRIDFNDPIQTRKWIIKHKNDRFVRYDFVVTNNDSLIVIPNINTEDKKLRSKDEIIKDLWCELLVSDTIIANLVDELALYRKQQLIQSKESYQLIK